MTSHRIRRAGAGALAAAVLLLSTGCGLFGRDVERLPQGTREVTVQVGETAQVSLGWINPSIGDIWSVYEVNPEGIAAAKVVKGENVVGGSSPDAPGSGTFGAVEIMGEKAGTTTVTVLYCTRTEVEPGCDQSLGTLTPPVEPLEIEVTVTER